ncbi:hypothetical protein ABT001_25905 [Streptomyces sp. NPDC002793]
MPGLSSAWLRLDNRRSRDCTLDGSGEITTSAGQKAEPRGVPR